MALAFSLLRKTRILVLSNKNQYNCLRKMMADVCKKQDIEFSGGFLQFILSEVKYRLPEEKWKTTEELLESKCQQNGKSGSGDPFEEDSECCQAQSWVQWARSHKDLKVVSAQVPEGILPSGITGRLHDIKVFSRGSDDALYESNEELRRKVARGNCFLELTSPFKTATCCVTYALKKFTGGLGDDDDRDKGDDYVWKTYFTKPFDDCRSVVCTSKANGEAAHVSALFIDGQPYLCAGSKNVHMIFRNKDDVDKYDPNEMRYSIAREVAYCILDMLDSVSPERRLCFIQLLAVTRLTAVFEILHPDHPHVEDLSFLSAPQIKFITWTAHDLSPSVHDSFLSWLPPDISIEVARVFGLSTIDYSVIDINEVEERMSKIRHYHNVEGEVLFFLDENQNTIGILKKKSIWYILLRALREKVRFALRLYKKDQKNFDLEKENERIVKRYKEIQQWLGLSDDIVNNWKSMGTEFLKWVVDGINSNSIDSEDLMTKFPIYWQKFLEVTEKTDKIPENCSTHK